MKLSKILHSSRACFSHCLCPKSNRLIDECVAVIGTIFFPSTLCLFTSSWTRKISWWMLCVKRNESWFISHHYESVSRVPLLPWTGCDLGSNDESRAEAGNAGDSRKSGTQSHSSGRVFGENRGERRSLLGVSDGMRKATWTLGHNLSWGLPPEQHRLQLRRERKQKTFLEVKSLTEPNNSLSARLRTHRWKPWCLISRHCAMPRRWLTSPRSWPTQQVLTSDRPTFHSFSRRITKRSSRL